MAWRAGDFKGKDVWIEVTAAGLPAIRGGRVSMRYSPKQGATIYRGGAASITVGTGPILDLPAGLSADDMQKARTQAGRGSGFGKAGTRSKAQAAAAQQSAAELVASLPKDAALCFTDGACKGNPGPAGAGCVVKLPGGEHHEGHRALGTGTNNIGELTAIGMALDILDQVGFDGPVHILTDSKYSTGVLSMGWKAKANKALIATVKDKVRKHDATIHWIAGHVGIAENERADALANLGVEESRGR
ncbi:MAG: reverse transcriptase-like protein [Oligoflexia bacterium]|nr:reverse transcriptase-like protein [Oligoflexia bacterium]